MSLHHCPKCSGWTGAAHMLPLPNVTYCACPPPVPPVPPVWSTPTAPTTHVWAKPTLSDPDEAEAMRHFVANDAASLLALIRRLKAPK